MTYQTVLNVTQTSIVIDTAGHVLGAREPYLYDDATISPANFAILQAHLNAGRLRLLTSGVTVPSPTEGASLVAVEVSGQNLVFTDSFGNKSTVTVPGGAGGVDLTPYAKTTDVQTAITSAVADKASTTDLSTGLATKVNSSTYTAGIATVTQTANDAATAANNALTPYTLPASNGTDDTAAINAVLDAARLNGGGVVRGRPGVTYVTKDRLIVGSHTTLDMTGCLINGANNRQTLANYAAVTGRTVTDAVTTAGSTTLTSATAAFTSADVGKAVQVIAAGPNYGRSDAPGSWYATISSVTNATTAVLSQAATLAKTGATATIFAGRDSNITVTGGTWTGGEREAVSQSLNGHAMYFRRVDGLKVSPRRMVSTRSGGDGGGGGYAISCGDVTRVEAFGTDFAVGSDGVHFQGPAQFINVHDVSGRTGDDLVAFTGVDGQSQTGSFIGDVEGDITDVTVTNIQPNNAWTALKITSGQGANNTQRRIRRFYAQGITGRTQQGSVNVVDYAGTTWFEGSIRGVNTIVGGPTFHQVRLRATFAQQVRLDDIVWDSTLGAPTVGAIRVDLPVTDLRISNFTAPGGYSGAAIGVNLAAAVTRFSLAGLSIPDNPSDFTAVAVTAPSLTFASFLVTGIYRRAQAGNLVGVLTAATDTIFTDFVASDGYMTAGSVLAFSADSSTKSSVRINNWRQTAGALTIARGPMDVALANTQIAVSSTAAVQAASAAATPIRVKGSNVTLDSGVILSRTGTQSLSLSGAGVPVDASLLAPQAGDQVYNTNSAAAGGVGALLSNGTGWQNLTTGSSTNFTVPGTPTGLTVTPASTSAALAWTTPSSNGGTPITDYAYQYKLSSGSTWTTVTHAASTATNAIVTGLTPSTAYDFRVAAVNQVGTGTYTAAVSATTASASAANAYRTAVLADSPTALWMLDDTGTTVADSTANGYNGTTTGSVTRGTPAPGAGAPAMTSFTGGYASTATLGSFGSQLKANGLTIEFIYRGTSTARGTVVGTVNTGSATSIAVFANASAVTATTSYTVSDTPGSLFLGTRSETGASSGGSRGVNIPFAALNDGNSHHVVITFNATTDVATAYIDGNAITVTKVGTAISGTFGNFGFPVGIAANNGRGTFDTFLAAELAGVALYPAILTSTQATAHRNALINGA